MKSRWTDGRSEEGVGPNLVSAMAAAEPVCNMNVKCPR